MLEMVIRPRNKLAVYLITILWSMGLTAFAQSGVSASGNEQLKGPAFVPDDKVPGFHAGWMAHPGAAEWRADKGELIGKGTPGSGWLVLDHSYQDTGFYAGFRCAGACDTGVLLRATKTEGGMTGTYLSIQGDQLKAESLTMDDRGNIIARTMLRNAVGQIRFAPSQPDPIAAQVAPEMHYSQPPGPANVPFKFPDLGLREGEWNEVEMLLDADLMRVYLNNSPERNQLSVATEEDDMDSYGPIALFVGKGSEVRFKDVSYKDIAIRKSAAGGGREPLPHAASEPLLLQLDRRSGGLQSRRQARPGVRRPIFYGPDFTTSREMYRDADVQSFHRVFHLGTTCLRTSPGMDGPMSLPLDLGVGAVLYVNPGNESRRWKQYKILPTDAERRLPARQT